MTEQGLPQQSAVDGNSRASGTGWSRWRFWTEVLVGTAALAEIALFLIASLGRLRYAFPLEQLEGPMLLTAERVAHGLPVYVRPTFHFIPYMYAPAYYYVSGWAVRMLGPGFLPLRLVSLLSTCVAFAIIYIFVLLDTTGTRRRRHLAALAGAGLYAAAYPWTRGWFDLGRLDSFYVFLLLLALLCTRWCRRSWHPAIAAAAWTLAFLAKQTIFPVALIMLCFDWKRPRRVLMGAGSFLLMVAVTTGLLNFTTRGWFRFYAFTVPRANADLLLRPAVFFIFSQLLAPFAVAGLIAAIAWTRMRAKKRGMAEVSSRARFYLLAAISTFGLCWFLQAHGGATMNTPMPMYAALAVIFGISFGRIDASLALEGCREPARVLLLAAVAIPLVSWIYNPRDFVPHRYVIGSESQMIAWMRTFPGDVYLPSHPYEAVLAGKSWRPDMAALHDALAPDIPPIRLLLLKEIRSEIDGEKFDAIGFDGPPAQALASEPWLPRDLETHYPIVGLVPGGEAGNPFTPHPVYFLLPCREQARAVSAGWTLLRTSGQASCAQ